MPPARFDVFISTLSFPTAIARDPSCQCWAVSNILGSPAIAWFNDAGTPHKGKGPVPAGPYNPYGLGVVPSGLKKGNIDMTRLDSIERLKIRVVVPLARRMRLLHRDGSGHTQREVHRAVVRERPGVGEGVLVRRPHKRQRWIGTSSV